MVKSKILKNSIALITLSLVMSCTRNMTPASPSDTDVGTTVNQNTTNSSPRDESKKPEPFISGETSEGSASSGSGVSKDSYGTPPVAEVIGGREPMPMATTAPTSMPGAVFDSPSGDTGLTSDSSSSYTAAPVKRLSAGDIDDNVKFSEYLTFLNSMSTLGNEDIIKLDVSDRYTISIKDKNGNVVPDAVIKISSSGNVVFTGKTYSNGKVLFMPSVLKSQFNQNDCNQQQQDCISGNVDLNSNFKVTVEKNNETITQDFSPSKDNKNWEIQLNNIRNIQDTINLDLTFLVDATGSMGDEISSIQKTIKDISARIKQISSDKTLNIRYSLISYKDKGDSYRVKRYDFTTNLEAYQEILNELTAGGGGDYKESLNEALDNAVNKITWTNDKEALRLIFLIADAPPHLDYNDDVKYPVSINSAVRQAIKIYPVSASGLSSVGEYIFRQLAQFTYSKFLFLTYGGDEQTPGTTPHNVGTFKETNLDDLVVNIVKEEITQFSSK